jgi:single-strand DNA-binding protein
VNVVVVKGKLSRPPEVRELPSGDHVVSLDVTVRPPEGRSETVPVVWYAAPAGALHLEQGTEVVVTGRVRRRFYRTGGTTQSRTEVVASAVIPTSRRQRASKAVERAVAELTGEA